MNKTYKNHRNPNMVRYFNSLDFYLDCHLREDYHEVRYFDEFLDDLENILSIHEDEIMFYTGWNYRPIKETKNNRIHKYGICKYRNDETIDIPIYLYFYERRNEQHTTVNRKSDKIVISINSYNLDIKLLRYGLQHEFTHIVCDYSEEKHANLDNLRNTISYDDNVFDIPNESFINIMRMVYWINKSEQEVRIGATLKYIRERRLMNNENDIDEVKTIQYIKDSYFLNQLDLFKKDMDELRSLSDEEIYILGYYMQMHHFYNGRLYKEFVIKSIETDTFNKTILIDIQNAYSFRYNDYRKKLYHYIINQKI